MSQSRQGTPSVTATCLVTLPACNARRVLVLLWNYFKLFLATTLSNVSTYFPDIRFRPNLVKMTSDQARRCPLTFDTVRGQSRSKGSKVTVFVHSASSPPGFMVMFTMTDTHASLQCSSTEVIELKIHPGSCGVTGVKRSSESKKSW